MGSCRKTDFGGLLLIMTQKVEITLFIACSFRNRMRASHGTYSSNHPIRSRQHIRRNGEIDLFGGFQIYDQLELCRLFDRQVSRLGAFDNLIYVRGGSAGQIGKARSITHKPAGRDKFLPKIYRRQPIFEG